MAPDRPRKGPTLPLHLLKEIDQGKSDRQPRGRANTRTLTRKERRKETRAKKRIQPSARKRSQDLDLNESDFQDESSEDEPTSVRNSKTSASKKTVSGMKNTGFNVNGSESEESFNGLFEDDEDAELERSPVHVSYGVRDRLAKDDAEIAALEKRLGIKGRKLPKSFQDDGLGDLLGHLDEGSAGGKGTEARKRKAEYDDWLSRKRTKSNHGRSEEPGTDSSEDDASDGDSDSLGVESDAQSGSEEESANEDGAGGDESTSDSGDDSLESDDGSELDDSDNARSATKSSPERPRENPYTAPTTGNIVKYVPPAARQNIGSDHETTAQIRRQVQGLMNRMSDSNMLGIISSVEQLYRDHPRSHVSDILVELLLERVCEPTNLLDKYLILYGGFATAIYRTVGIDFGAKLIQDIVQQFEQRYQVAKIDSASSSATSKETSNLIGLVSQLYTFQLIGSRLVFDYIRWLLSPLSELNTELLLRVIRTSGTSLRQDDPLALKDIVSLIRPAVSSIGEKNLSVRTGFMIDTINDLKNNKMKPGAADSAANAEHVSKMRKMLGSLNSRKLKATEPLRVGLNDIRDSDTKGKWWLVGASWAGKSSQNDNDDSEKAVDENHYHAQDSMREDDVAIYDGEYPDLWKLAREQKINTVTQQSIFVAILSSADFEDAYARIQKLRLNKGRRGEVSTVLVQCVGAEEHYNPYYTLVAHKICTADRKVRYSFQDTLWKFFRRLGQPIFDDEADEVDEDDEIDMRRIVNVAKMFGALVARGALGLSILKCLDMPYLQPKTKTFVEVMLVTVLLEAMGGDTKAGNQQAVEKVFATTTLEQSRGLQWILKKVISRTDLVRGKEEKTLKRACNLAEMSLENASAAEADVVREG